MLTNTQTFYSLVKNYQTLRRAENDSFDQKLEALERFKGSSGYSEDVEKLKSEHEAELQQIKSEYAPKLDTVLGAMVDQIGKRTLSAPTADQMALLNALKMRQSITPEECERAARALKTSPIAIDILQDLAAEKGLRANLHEYRSEMSTEAAEKVIRSMATETRDFLNYDSLYPARKSFELHHQLYGDDGRRPEKAPLFDSYEECYQRFAGLTGKELELFGEAVNGSQNND